MSRNGMLRIETFSNFVGSEREHYVGADNNRVAFSLGQIGRYLRFVAIIKRRHAETNSRATEDFRRAVSAKRESGVRQLTPEEMEDLERDRHTLEILHLETESFFLFAKITLDKVAQFIEDYFGSAPGLSLRSHDKWCKNASNFVAAKQLDLPNELLDTMTLLKGRVSDYRDKQIAHLKNPRAMFITHFPAEGSAHLGTTYLYPKESDRYSKSPGVEELYKQLEKYVSQLIELIVSNRLRSRYKLRAG